MADERAQHPPDQDDDGAGTLEAGTTEDRASSDEARTHHKNGGPYYLAPDSADPPPSGMWATLDATAVEVEVDRVNAALADGTYSMNKPPAALRERLESGGPAARKLLASLKRSARPSAETAEQNRTPS